MTDVSNDASFLDDDAPHDTAWFLTEASGFIGSEARRDPLLNRVAERMRRRVRPEHLISNSIFGLMRHAATAGLYLGLAYAAKLAFGVSLVFNTVR
jgi:hypothetical protein